MKTLTDKVVVITGAGSGIGRALAVEVAGRGALLAISDIDETGLAETVDLVKNLSIRGQGAREVRADRPTPPGPSSHGQNRSRSVGVYIADG